MLLQLWTVTVFIWLTASAATATPGRSLGDVPAALYKAATLPFNKPTLEYLQFQSQNPLSVYILPKHLPCPWQETPCCRGHIPKTISCPWNWVRKWSVSTQWQQVPYLCHNKVQASHRSFPGNSPLSAKRLSRQRLFQPWYCGATQVSPWQPRKWLSPRFILWWITKQGLGIRAH